MSATEELDHIDRYFSKNWMDEDFPTDEIYAALAELAALKQELQALREQKPIAYYAITEGFPDNPQAWMAMGRTYPIAMPLYAAPMPVREGWRLLPIEPTEKMEQAFYPAILESGKRNLYPVWKALLEAAPKEPS